MKKFFLLCGSALLLANMAGAQKKICGTDENRARALKDHPEILQIEAKLEKEIQQRIANGTLLHSVAKGAGLDFDTTYDVPVVFHVVHDYGEEDVSDAQIQGVLDDMNTMYNRRNSDTTDVIAPYAGNIPGTTTEYKGKANITFHFATIDPEGKPTTGITRTNSFFANNAGDQSKIDQWAPDSYVNIWLIHNMSGTHTGAAAYATPPSLAAIEPYSDGVITIVQASTSNPLNSDHTISHEVGHIFNLAHPFGSTNSPQIACGDDGVDDTPPTKGHYNPGGCVPANLYDTLCSRGYKVTYSWNQYMALYGNDAAGHAVGQPVTIDYPDTVNSQNIMDYTYCSKMFTYGQVVRMRTALNTPVAGRANLISATNHAHTGALAARPDLSPIADFSPTIDFHSFYQNGQPAYSYNRHNFICADGSTSVNLKNFSWRDTIASSTWTIGGQGSTPLTVNTFDANGVSFSQPGWVPISLTVTSNAGSNTLTKNDAVYAADPNNQIPITGGYVQSFNQGADLAQWPIFNYYNSSAGNKWEVINTTGYNDNTSIRFTNYDPRPYYLPNTQTLTSDGVYADFFTRAFDFTNNDGTSNLTFAYAGAFRTNNPDEMNDMLEITYSDDCGASWQSLDNGKLTKGTLGNNGFVSGRFTPAYAGQWSWYSIPMGSVGTADKVFFRFRYSVGSNNAYDQLGSGNNFYIDRIGVNSYGLGVNPTQFEADGMTVSPNPTSGAATVTVKGGDNTTAIIHVTDVTGKVVYTTEAALNATATKVVIPADRISVKGLYMVQVIANGKTSTQKLTVF